MMKDVYVYLSGLPEETRQKFVPIFGSIDRFYTVVYLIAQNGHATEQDKPSRWEEKLQVIRQVEKKVEKLLNSYFLDGKEIMAEIASDYFNDFVKYKQLEPDITNDEFISIIQRISLFA